LGLWGKTALWGAASGVISVMAYVIGIAQSSHVSALAVGSIIAVVSVLSAFSGGYPVRLALKSERTLKEVGKGVGHLENTAEQDKARAVALVAYVFYECVTQIEQALTEPSRFNSAAEDILAGLCGAICHHHRWGGHEVRASLIIDASAAQLNNGTQASGKHSVPSDSPLRFDFTDKEVNEQFAQVMDRRYPFKRGCLWDGHYQSTSDGETRPLPPPGSSEISYIRVGVPGIGVLCVDSSDKDSRLVVADRTLALAVADLLSITKRTYFHAGQSGLNSSVPGTKELN
jgi:hypothetical protein